MLQSIGVFLTKSIGFHLRCSWANFSFYTVFLRLYPETFPQDIMYSPKTLFFAHTCPSHLALMVKYIHSSPEKPSTKYNLTHNWCAPNRISLDLTPLIAVFHFSFSINYSFFAELVTPSLSSSRNEFKMSWSQGNKEHFKFFT